MSEFGLISGPGSAPILRSFPPAVDKQPVGGDVPVGTEALATARQRVFQALDAAKLRWRRLDTIAAPPRGTALAVIALHAADMPRAAKLLRQQGFLPLAGGRRRATVRYVGFDRDTGGWLTLTSRVEPAEARDSPARTAGTSLPSLLADRLRQLAGRVRVGGRSRGADVPRISPPAGLTVALLGQDGSGKSTLAGRLAAVYPLPAQSLYMGLWQREAAGKSAPRIPGLSLASRLLLVWRRFLAGQYHRARGRLVIFDRYNFDALLPHPGRRGALERLYVWLLAHACPPPDLTVVLDVTGEVAYLRKGERSMEQLEEERQGFLGLRGRVPRLEVVNANRPLAEVEKDLVALVWSRHCERD